MLSANSKGTIKLFSAIVFVYVILFEFILPINRFLPKPSLLLDSIHHIWRDYNLLYAVTTTASIVFISLLLGYVSAFMNLTLILKFYRWRPGSFEAIKLFCYVPAIIVVAAFYFWFKNYLFAEILFGLLSSCIMIYGQMVEHSKKVGEEYVLVAKNFGFTETEILEKVYWKAIQPPLLKDFLKNHLRLWSLILLFEFAANSFGIGYIIRSILDYKDFTALFNIFIFITLLMWAGDLFIRFIRAKIIFWEV
jgi:ABC-type nitrate/sulfonate/bicarbonate transport system permease component